MITRSQSNLREEEMLKREINVNIDFDEASREWRKSKNILKMECIPIKKVNIIAVILKRIKNVEKSK